LGYFARVLEVDGRQARAGRGVMNGRSREIELGRMTEGHRGRFDCRLQGGGSVITFTLQLVAVHDNSTSSQLTFRQPRFVRLRRRTGNSDTSTRFLLSRLEHSASIYFGSISFSPSHYLQSPRNHDSAHCFRIPFSPRPSFPPSLIPILSLFSSPDPSLNPHASSRLRCVQ
jgi:hypothetical protein